MTNIYNYSKIKVDGRGVRGVVLSALKDLRRGGIFRKKRAYDIRIIFVTPSESRKLNKAYRKKDRPTNVLSFDYDAEGEIILCPAIIKKEAMKAGNTFRWQMAWMIVHGLIHLGGVHHEKSRAMNAKVEKVEKRFMAKINNFKK